MAARWIYRSRQFFQTLIPVISAETMEEASHILTPTQMSLFLKMQKSEQAHSLRVFHELINQGEKDHNLLVAALLHDVGKICQPLHAWERVMIVLAQAFFSHTTSQWGAKSGAPLAAVPFWQRAFVVAGQHPGWGADLALEAGVSPLTASLIRRHQEKLPHANKNATSQEDQLLCKLKAVDDHR